MLKITKAVWHYRHHWLVTHQSFRAVKVRLFRMLALLVALCSLHTLAMVIFEKLSFLDGLWLTLTTVTTVGYGDFSAVSTEGRLATIVLMYLAGITVLAQVFGEFIDYRLERKQRMISGRWRWKSMRNHILVVNVPSHGTDRYLSRLVRQIRSNPGFVKMPIQLLTPEFSDGLPMSLREMGVVHRCARASDSVVELQKANVEQAYCVFVLAEDAYNPQSDSVSLDILCHLKSLNFQGKLVVEAIRDENKARFKAMGAKSVLRPVRAYPELMVRALVAPGSEVLLEDLFTYGGVRPERAEVAVSGCWGDMASALIRADLGLPLGYIDREGETYGNPHASATVDAQALLVMLNDDQQLDAQSIEQALRDFLVTTE